MKKLSGRVVLIASGNNATIENSSHAATIPHLGIIYVGTHMQKSGFEVKLIDEDVSGGVEIENVVKTGDIVGFSAVITTVERAVQQATRAKQCGAAYTFLGNDAAADAAHIILSDPRFQAIDGIFTGDSMKPVGTVFAALRKTGALPQQKVRGFARRMDNGVLDISLGPEVFDLVEMGMPNLALYPKRAWRHVWKNHNNTFGREYGGASVRNSSIMLAGGCVHGNNACVYCSIKNVDMIRQSGSAYLLELLGVYDAFGINSFFDAADDLLGIGTQIRVLNEVGYVFDHFACYARAQYASTDPKRIEMIRSIVRGRLKFNCGLDSWSDAMLLALNKGSDLEANRNMVKIMKRLGIYGHFSFIFGAPGETRETAEQTLEGIHWVFDTMGDLVANCEADIQWITRGASIWQIVMSYEYARKLALKNGKELTREVWARELGVYANQSFVPIELQHIWFKWFTKIEYDEALAYVERVQQMTVGRHTQFGRAFRGA